MLQDRAHSVESISVLEVQQRALEQEVKVSKEVAIGFKRNFGNQPHLYIQVGDLRYDADIFPRRPTVITTLPGFYEPGLVQIFRDLPEETFQQLYRGVEAELNNGPRFSLSCITGGCKILNESGIVFEHGTPLIPSEALEAIFTKDLLDPTGKPLQFDLLEIHTIAQELPSADQLVQDAQRMQEGFIFGGKALKLVARQLGLPVGHEFFVLGLAATGATATGGAVVIILLEGKTYLIRARDYMSETLR